MNNQPRARLFTVFMPSRELLKVIEEKGITTTDQLVDYTESDLLAKGLDTQSIHTIQKRLKQYGYKLKSEQE
jgi:DNA-directed RNA polymerase alpha subunit